MNTEPVSNYTADAGIVPVLIPSRLSPNEATAIRANGIVESISTGNGAKRNITSTPSWNHIELETKKPGWVVSLGILAVLSTLLLGMWLEQQRAANANRVDSPADVPEIRSHLTGELTR
jgi:cyanate permease